MKQWHLSASPHLRWGTESDWSLIIDSLCISVWWRRWWSVSSICSQQTEEVTGDALHTSLPRGERRDDESNAHCHATCGPTCADYHCWCVHVCFHMYIFNCALCGDQAIIYSSFTSPPVKVLQTWIQNRNHSVNKMLLWERVLVNN